MATESSPSNADLERKLAISETIERKKKIIGQIAAVPSINNGKKAVTSGKQTVILTGSTGALGSYLLLELLDNPLVGHIYCLNRGADSQQSQINRNKSRGLPTNFPSDRVTFLTGNPTKPNFGLDPDVYSQLFQTTTKIIHNAWAVSLMVPLSAFEEQIDGVIALAKFAYDSPTNPRLHFISSTSAVRGLSDASIKIPEEIITDDSAPPPMGYGQSKYVSELVLDYAAEKLLIDVQVARLGAIAGPAVKPGYANKDDLFLVLLISSVLIGAVPDSLGVEFDKIDWMAVDLLSEILVDLTLAPKTGSGGKAVVYHPQNPVVGAWKDIIPGAVKNLLSKKGRDCEIVSLKEWLKRVSEDAEASGLKGDELEKRSPAMKLLPFYGIVAQLPVLPTFDLVKTLEASEKLRNVGPIKQQWLENWCEAWS